jgi:hypothetical protein
MPNSPRFALGQVVATPAAIDALSEARESGTTFLARHVAGDWGDLGKFDKRQNDRAVKEGMRILSSYTLSSGKQIWIITEAADEHGNRSCTTILLPQDY